MDWLSILILILIGIWFIAAVIYMVRHKGCGCEPICSRECSICKRNCKSEILKD